MQIRVESRHGSQIQEIPDEMVLDIRCKMGSQIWHSNRVHKLASES
jgi:hypothetical protein